MVTVGHAAAHHIIPLTTSKHIRQGAFARPIGSHDRVHFARRDIQVNTFENGFSTHLYHQVGNTEHI